MAVVATSAASATADSARWCNGARQAGTIRIVAITRAPAPATIASTEKNLMAAAKDITVILPRHVTDPTAATGTMLG